MTEKGAMTHTTGSAAAGRGGSVAGRVAWGTFVVLLGALWVSGCAGYRKPDPATVAYVEGLANQSDGTNILTQYMVGPEDVLEVRVWGDEALSKTVQVRPDGMITLPLVGDIKAAGRASADLAAEIVKRLKRYKSTPQVDVNLSQINSYRIYLLGEVSHPGMLQVRNFTTLLQAIALAGGPSRFADNEIVLLRRNRDTGIERVLHLDYRMLSSDKEALRPYNLVLWPGDTVILK